MTAAECATLKDASAVEQVKFKSRSLTPIRQRRGWVRDDSAELLRYIDASQMRVNRI
jgi:hypothetical protein